MPLFAVPSFDVPLPAVANSAFDNDTAIAKSSSAHSLMPSLPGFEMTADALPLPLSFFESSGQPLSPWRHFPNREAPTAALTVRPTARHVAPQKRDGTEERQDQG